MKLTFLGTSAGEGYPGLWCECENCTYAREHGGKNHRENSCAVLDEDVLLDLNMTAFSQAWRFGKELRHARVLLVTHAHEDHFVSQHLHWRRMTEGADRMDPETRSRTSSPRFTGLPRLHVMGSRYVLDALRAQKGGIMEGREGVTDADWADDSENLDFTIARPGVTLTFPDAGDLRVTPVHSVHGPAGDYTCNYIIEREGKCFLYALDTGGYTEENVEILKKFRYDAVIMEGTFGLNSVDLVTHMNLEKNKAWLRFFEENGLFKGEPRMILSHICPHWAPPHDIYAPIAEKEGMTVAYDGLEIEI